MWSHKPSAVGQSRFLFETTRESLDVAHSSASDKLDMVWSGIERDVAGTDSACLRRSSSTKVLLTGRVALMCSVCPADQEIHSSRVLWSKVGGAHRAVTALSLSA